MYQIYALLRLDIVIYLKAEKLVVRYFIIELEEYLKVLLKTPHNSSYQNLRFHFHCTKIMCLLD